MRDVTISFKATPELADWLATLGAQSDNTRSNLCYSLLVACQHNQADELIRVMESRRGLAI